MVKYEIYFQQARGGLKHGMVKVSKECHSINYSRKNNRLQKIEENISIEDKILKYPRRTGNVN